QPCPRTPPRVVVPTTTVLTPAAAASSIVMSGSCRSALQPGIRSCPRQISGRQNAMPAAVLAASWSWASPMNSRYGVRRVTALTFRRGCASRMILGKREQRLKVSPRNHFWARWSSDEPFAAGMAAILPSDSGDDPARDGVFRAARTRMPRAAIRRTGEGPTASSEEIGDEPGHSLPFLASRGFRRKRRQRMGSGYCDLVCGCGGGQLRGRSKRHHVQLSRPADADQRALIVERVAPRTTNRDEPAARVVLRLRGAGRALRLPIATTVPAERRYHHRRGRVFGRVRQCGAGRY